MRVKHLQLQLCGILLGTVFAACPSPAAPEEHGVKLLETITGGSLQGLAVSEAKIVEQVPNPWSKSPPDPVWCAKLIRDGRECGYLIWEKEGTEKLIEFSLSPVELVAGDHLVSGVPNLQQFGVPGQSAPEVCSGCVPTAAANLVAFWSTHRFPQWGEFHEEKSPSLTELQAVATRLRGLLKMSEIPDTLGYTDDHHPLSGAMPENLAEALRTDAQAHSSQVTVGYEHFSTEHLCREIDAGRPVLVSCFVRLPHKPQLSWGHELTGIGWVEIAGDLFIAVRDNYYPSKENDTRWIRSDAFDSLIVVTPGS